MTTEQNEQQQQEQAADTAAAEAAFAASFSGEPAPTPTPSPTPAPTEEPKKDEAEEQKDPEPTPTPAPTPSPTPAPSFDAQAEIRRLQGQYGALHDLLTKSAKAKEGDGKPPVLTKPELKRMKEQFPELAEFLQEDLAESLAALAPKAPAPEEVAGLVDKRVDERVAQGVAREIAAFRDQFVTGTHATWKTDLWQDGKLGGSRTADYTAWLKSMPEADAKAFEDSDNPIFVSKRIADFYEWRAAASKAKQQKEDRLKANITPQGVPRAGQQQLPEREAMEKGFLEGFNS